MVDFQAGMATVLLQVTLLVMHLMFPKFGTGRAKFKTFPEHHKKWGQVTTSFSPGNG